MKHCNGIFRWRRSLSENSPASEGKNHLRWRNHLENLDSGCHWVEKSSRAKHFSSGFEGNFVTNIQSANVFLSKSGKAKLGDMNVSKIAKNGLLYTQTGTPYYASPEVWKDKPYDSKSDIWSLGCILYEMATLKPPFRAEDMDGLYKKVIKGSYQKIGESFSKSLSSAIKSMLQVNPSNRPSAEQLLKNLSSKV